MMDTCSLEREDVSISADNRLFYSIQAIAPVGEAKNDYDILCDLAQRLGFGNVFSEGRTAKDWLGFLLAQSEVENIQDFKKTDFFLGKGQKRVGLSEFIKNPNQAPLNTPSGKIEIKSKTFAMTGFSAIPEVRIYKLTKHIL